MKQERMDYHERFPFGLLAIPFKLCGVPKEPVAKKTAAELLAEAKAYLNKIQASAEC